MFSTDPLSMMVLVIMSTTHQSVGTTEGIVATRAARKTIQIRIAPTLRARILNIKVAAVARPTQQMATTPTTTTQLATLLLHHGLEMDTVMGTMEGTTHQSATMMEEIVAIIRAIMGMAVAVKVT